MFRQLKRAGVFVFVGFSLALTGCAGMPDPAESAELAELRKEYACNPRYGYRPVPLVPEQNVPLLPEPVYRTPPLFPKVAIDRATSGEVHALVEINEEGSVDHVDLVSETPRGCYFAEMAIDAIKRWRFATGNSGIYSTVITFNIE